ncbi:peptidase A24 [Mixta theicola]|uniref:Peptidase A24 n=1 Tax=Mixta theicola TaxID=1458355 RepID=A0A2K1Q9Y5_9GAMM|nr:prepilin peptidase [Mixta theicola]PNS11840.1 peptidase A24 [Mixta theicola]GLR07764.1 hypothetical protein GCM10007905_04830 [Mixta theicola]
MLWLFDVNFIIIMLVLLFIAWQDILLRTITHRSLLCLFFCLLPLLFLPNWQLNFFAAILIFIIGFVLFYVRVIGGGDVKLMALLALFMPEKMLTDFLLLTAFIGGAIVLFGLIFFRRQIREHGVPYGVAISLAFIFLIPCHHDF